MQLCWRPTPSTAGRRTSRPSPTRRRWAARAAARRGAGDARARSQGSGGAWASLFGGDDGWPAASAAIEAHFLKRLCLPGRFTARAWATRLAYGLPSVLRPARRPDAVVGDGALDACRDAFRRSLRDDRASLEVKCAALCGAWRSFLHLAGRAGRRRARAASAVSSASDAVVAAPPLCAAAGLQQLLPRLEQVRWTAAALETHCRAPALAPLLAGAVQRSARSRDRARRAPRDARDPDAAHRVAAEARAAAATHAAADPAFAARARPPPAAATPTPFGVVARRRGDGGAAFSRRPGARGRRPRLRAERAVGARARAGLGARARAARDLGAVAVRGAALLGVAAGGAGEPSPTRASPSPAI
ncbi:hypothetical protein SO694_00079172 [Aureococcus anophagefferens]|uniref:Uncharacterized protein n=1 Tax=Aureococcus anophagefferens TaxID=44056 RepID=A0ABR1FGY5_AURAN